ncbi:BHLH domain-containing protein [Mycena kentingensis (nom. inval.)]|nr:BHLH domain-containing protein [Mycena kentingensis (nom. inval.)]
MPSSSRRSASSLVSPTAIAAPRPLAPTLSPVSDLELDLGYMGRRNSVDSDDIDGDYDEKHTSVAARRASHNAVERARRDKLNARILQLSTLLPNLAGVRRPSRLAITKSSIAQVHLARRHRMVASQQLRQLQAENDALRGEINRWRSRSGVPALPDIERGDAFHFVASGAECAEMLEPVDALDEDDFDERYGGVGCPGSGGYAAARYHNPYAGAGAEYLHSPSMNFAYGAPTAGTPAYPSPPYPSPPSSADFLHAPAGYDASTGIDTEQACVKTEDAHGWTSALYAPSASGGVGVTVPGSW